MTASAEARETALLAAQAAADKLATDVSIVDVSDRLAITDAFVLASAPNERQVQSIVDAVEERLREHGIKPVRREGVAESRWVLLDFIDVVVHVQHAEERAYYALERLWKDCPTIPFADRPLRPVADRLADGTPTADVRPAPTSRDAAPVTGDDRPVSSALPGCRCRGWCSGGTGAPSGTPPAASRVTSILRSTTWAGTRPSAPPHLVPPDCPGRGPSWSPATSAGPRRQRQHSPPLGVPLRSTPRLREHGMGSWEGLTRDEVAERYPEQFADWMAGRPVRGRGGEDPAEVADRALAALADLPPPGGRGVTHGGTAGRLLERLLGIGPEHRRVFGALGNCAWSELALQGGRWRLIRHNSSVAAAAGRRCHRARGPSGGVRPPPTTHSPETPTPMTDADAAL